MEFLIRTVIVFLVIALSVACAGAFVTWSTLPFEPWFWTEKVRGLTLLIYVAASVVLSDLIGEHL